MTKNFKTEKAEKTYCKNFGYNVEYTSSICKLIWEDHFMITAGDFRNGVTFEMDGNVMQVVELQHVNPGKGAAFVRTKMKNVITGAVNETSFSPTDKFESAFIERRTMEYSYSDGDLYYFMDP